MAVVHVKKRDNPYVQIDKRVFEDTRLSWRSKGIMGYLLSKPDGWKVNVIDIWGKGKEGRNAVQDCMAELKLHGYADLVTTHDENGVFTGKEWVVSEEPKNGFTDVTEKPKTDAPINRKSGFRSISNNELNSNNKEGEGNGKNETPLPPTSYDEMLERVNAETRDVEAKEGEGVSPGAIRELTRADMEKMIAGMTPAERAEMFAARAKDILEAKKEINPVAPPPSFLERIEAFERRTEKFGLDPTHIVRTTDANVLPGALITDVQGINLEPTNQTPAARVLNGVNRAPMAEDSDGAQKLIMAWATNGALETVQNWYNLARRKFTPEDLELITAKFCGTYSTIADAGRRSLFFSDPVQFFRNKGRVFIQDQKSFERMNEPKNGFAPTETKSNLPKSIRHF